MDGERARDGCFHEHQPIRGVRGEEKYAKYSASSIKRTHATLKAHINTNSHTVGNEVAI